MQYFALFLLSSLADASPLAPHLVWRQDLSNTSTSAVDMNAIYDCRGQPFMPSKYTCWDSQLCPVMGEFRNLACANSCYDPKQYSCADGKLQQASNGTAGPSAEAASTYPASLTLTGLQTGGGGSPPPTGTPPPDQQPTGTPPPETPPSETAVPFPTTAPPPPFSNSTITPSNGTQTTCHPSTTASPSLPTPAPEETGKPETSPEQSTPSAQPSQPPNEQLEEQPVDQPQEQPQGQQEQKSDEQHTGLQQEEQPGSKRDEHAARGSPPGERVDGNFFRSLVRAAVG